MGPVVRDHQRVEPRTSYFGRVDEQRLAADHVRATQLVTLTGTGGIGKTRLAHRIAADLADEAVDGVFFVDLTEVDGAERDGVANAVTAAVGAPSLPASVESLSAGTALLILDNCEHVLDEVADVADTLLGGSGDLRILATSREPIGLPDEQVVVVEPLGPSDAVALLRDRAAAAGATIEADPDTTSVLEELCERLDGVPLGLELAASRLRSLGPREVLTGLGASADLLRRTRGGDVRHRSLEDTVAWSYRLLDDDSARFFRALAVFPSDFGLDDVEAVIGRAQGLDRVQIADQLDRLVSQSLVVAASGPEGIRYRLLVVMRHLARAWMVEGRRGR